MISCRRAGSAPPITNDPPRHQNARRALLPAFTPAAVDRLVPRTREICNELTGLQQLTDDVGAQLGTRRDLSLPLGDEDPEVFGLLGETLLQFLARLDPRLELLKDPVPEPIAIAVWHAQQQGNDADGNVLGVVESRVAAAVVTGQDGVEGRAIAKTYRVHHATVGRLRNGGA